MSTYRPFGGIALAIAALACLAASQRPVRPRAPVQAPVVVVETVKGTFAFETFPDDAPRTVAHIAALVRSKFYDGQRVHRAQPGFVVQFGDPRSRDLSTRALWGRGAGAGSGTSVGVAEIVKKRGHTAGAVGLAHMGDPSKGDSQIYVTLSPRPDLDGQYAVFGRVVEGNDIPERLSIGDAITRVSVRE